MASAEQLRIRAEIGTALAQGQWTHAGDLAQRLRVELEAICRDRAQRGSLGDKARAYHRGGLFTVGFQRFMHAPAEVRRRLEGLNAVLIRLPFGRPQRE